MRNIRFSTEAKRDIFEFIKEKEYAHINTIIKLLLEIDKTNDKTSLGSPREVLYKELSGWLSRRISWRHRLVYKINTKEIHVLMCKEHY